MWIDCQPALIAFAVMLSNPGGFQLFKLLIASVYLFEVCWNDHLMNYFSRLHRYGINTNIAFNIFSYKFLIISCKTLIITVTSTEITTKLTL